MVCGGVLHHLADKSCPVGVVVFEPGPGRRANHDLSGMVCVPRPGKARQEYTTRLDVLLHKPLVDQMTAPRATEGLGEVRRRCAFWGGTKGSGAMWVSCRGILMGFYTACEMRAVWWCSWCWVRVGLLDFGEVMGAPRGRR